MKIQELIKKLSAYNWDRDVVVFANGYKEIKVINNEDGVIIAGKGKICPSVKTAIENHGKEPEPCDLCSCESTEDNSKLDTGE